MRPAPGRSSGPSASSGHRREAFGSRSAGRAPIHASRSSPSGLRYFQVQRRRVGGEWHSWGSTTATRRSITWMRAYDHEVRVRARDRAGNWGSWRIIRINL